MRFICLTLLLVSLSTSLPIASVYGQSYSTYKPKRKALLLMNEEELALRKWSLEAVSKILTFNHDTLMERFAENKDLQTEMACRKSLWILQIFEIDKAIERKEALVTSRNQRFPIKNTLEKIGVDPASKRTIERLGYPEGTKIWDLYVPVSIEFSKKMKTQSYKFLANIRVLARSNKIGDYVIISWYPAQTQKTIQRDSKKRFNKKNYEACEKIDFFDTDPLKKKDK